MTASPPETRLAGAPLRTRIATALEDGRTSALIGPDRKVSLQALGAQRFISAPEHTLQGRNVLICTDLPMAAALALVELDGVAARLVLCPPDVTPAQIALAAKAAEIELVVGDGDDPVLPELPYARIGLDPSAPVEPSSPSQVTQWALFTSGTSGAPKMVAHTLQGLTGAISATPAGDGGAPPAVWATFYDIRRYGGLQMLLRALTGGLSLLITDPHETLAAFLHGVGEHGVTHLAGTPSHWRRALMSPALDRVSPRYVRLSGEIADQAVLDSLKVRFPQAVVAHAFASTEAGVGFEVSDGMEGFPAAYLDRDAPVQIRVREHTLQLRSDRVALSYLGETISPIADADGWVDTGDLVERRGDRFHFLGRRSGVINVGGLKISPEEVEAVINACPTVRMSRVTGRKSSLLGALVTADVVLSAPEDRSGAREMILAHCRTVLPPHKTPASIRFVDTLAVSSAGKLERRLA